MVGGEGGIRTHETRERLLVFKTSPFNHSGTSPSIYFNDLAGLTFLENPNWHRIGTETFCVLF